MSLDLSPVPTNIFSSLLPSSQARALKSSTATEALEVMTLLVQHQRGLLGPACVGCLPAFHSKSWGGRKSWKQQDWGIAQWKAGSWCLAPSTVWLSFIWLVGRSKVLACLKRVGVWWCLQPHSWEAETAGSWGLTGQPACSACSQPERDPVSR